MINPAIVAPIALAVASPAASADEASLSRAVDSFEAARLAFDPPAIARLTAPDYVEVSPLGEVDPRAKMLGFYGPDKKIPAPPMTTTERTARVHGNVGIVTLRISYGPASVRAVYVARRERGQWMMISAQFTPIRSPRPS